jgi:hypothetical protein
MSNPEPQPNPELKNSLVALLEAIGKFLPFVPDRWHAAAAGLLGFLLLLVGAIFATTQAPGGGPTAPSFIPATAITVDLRDLTLTKDKHTGQVKSAVAADAVPIAPLMDWENIDVRLGRVQTWCLQEADVGAQQVFRDVMNQLSATFPRNIRWQEGCPGPYTLGRDAEVQCGGGSVACAGPQAWVEAPYKAPANSFTYANGRVTYSGVQHIELNLGHNVCGYSPASVMAPIYLPDGPTCTNPGAPGLEPEDWGNAIAYYGLDQPGGGAKPPIATPSPSPSPSPTPVPGRRQIQAQLWLYKPPSCPVTMSADGWCVTVYNLGGVPDSGEWATFVTVSPTGAIEFPDDFIHLDAK